MADQAAGLLSPFLRSRRIAAAKPYLKGRVLDFGCGVGALAQYVPAEEYLGVDQDEESLSQAREHFPTHRFVSTDADVKETFDTVIALAVIEHVKSPETFLQMLSSRLAPGGRIVVTTPHPSLEWAHQLGASFGLFSKEAEEEHETLLDFSALRQISTLAGLRLSIYRRFLCGANQLAVYER